PIEKFVKNFAVVWIGPGAAERFHVIAAQRRENEPAINKIARQRFVLIPLSAIVRVSVKRHIDGHFFFVAPNLKRKFLAGLNICNGHAEKDAIALVNDGAVAA